eukprot:Phypoly_transcript_10946.p1 GENE.Phypoly_transcript_10946~~Phypoly_transcript_10946.p1  ORF type:complete len:373 (+),score=57.51 Phypoly_transcript_10946:119-1237(+)
MNKGIWAFLFFVLFSYNVVEAGYFYIGTETESLYLAHFDSTSGSLSLVAATPAEYPSFLALHPSKQYLYSTNELEEFNGIENSGGISAYRINADSSLTFINSVPSYGGSPAHISVDSTGKWIGVANYGGGNYGVWKINSDFSIASQATTFKQDQNHGPQPQQYGPLAHEFVFGRNNTFVVVPNLGNDHWNQYTFSESTGALTTIQPIVAPTGSGPRHFAFHPTLPFAYGVSEIASTVTVFSAPAHLTSLSVIQSISTLPSPLSPSEAAAGELQFSPDGKLLYVSNRLTNVNGTIAIYTINQSSGLLTLRESFSTQGIFPRYFTLSEDGRFFFVANQLSNNIFVIERNQQTGSAGKVVSSLDGIVQPSHILFV